jgi:hypothetical protein
MRFESGELALLRSAEQLRGSQLAHGPARPDALRAALALAKAGRKLTSAGPGASVSLDESEVRLLREAVEAAAPFKLFAIDPLKTLAQFLKERGRDEEAALYDTRWAELSPTLAKRAARIA